MEGVNMNKLTVAGLIGLSLWLGPLAVTVRASAVVSLTSNFSTVAAGGNITFTVTVTPNTYVSSVSLAFEGESGPADDTTPPYVFVHQFNTPMNSLTVTATVRYSNSDPDGHATLDVDVVGLRIAGSATPTRGWVTTYQAESNPAGRPIDRFDWTFQWSGGSNSYEDDDQDADDRSTWTGKVVVSGTLRCDAVVAGVSVQKSLSVVVRARTWPIPITCAQDNEPDWGEEPEENASLTAHRDRDSDLRQYIFVPQSTEGDFSNARVLSEVTAGPCYGWWYVSSSTLKCQQETVINRYLESGGPLPQGATTGFYDINDSACFAPDYSTADFLQALANHEYRGTPDTFKSLEGHHGRLEKAILDLSHDAKAIIESLVARNSEDLAASVDDAIEYHQDLVFTYKTDESYMSTYGPNWGMGVGAIGWGWNSRWDPATASWTDCVNGPSDF
jgi:hypothetical protein